MADKIVSETLQKQKELHNAIDTPITNDPTPHS